MSDFNYEVLGDPVQETVDILIKVGPDHVDSEGNSIAENVESRLFAPGNVIPGDSLAAHIVEKYDAGDEYTLSILKQVKSEKPKVAKDEPKSTTEKKTPAKAASAEE